MAISIFCPHCHKHTQLSVARAEYKAENTGTGKTPAIWKTKEGNEWWIGICNGCQLPSLVLNLGDCIYPQPLPSATDSNVPKDLASDLDEAKMCFAVKCFRACAAMARRCIQNACMAKGSKSNDLVAQIRELTEAGIITKDIGEWATVVRWVGNDAAHPGKDPVKKEDAEDCPSLAEQFLHVIFVTPAIAKARRTARGK
ncbi:MAG: DUF4145 domain-containing protein [Planctomycetota bacterium]|nr:DUF4145 domain-containing protein [Planctomycetota bacterium]